MHRQCARCRAIKPGEDFTLKNPRTGARDCYCRPCRAEYGREHYVKKKQRYLEVNGARRRQVKLERMVWLVKFLREHPCADCGETDPVVLEFDHLRDKVFGIGQMLADRPWLEVLAEIEKCEVVCCNCHRRRTATRGNFLRAGVAQW